MLQSIIKRTANLAPVECSEITSFNGRVIYEYRFDCRILIGDYVIIQANVTESDEIMEKVARNMLLDDLLEMFKKQLA